MIQRLSIGLLLVALLAQAKARPLQVSDGMTPPPSLHPWKFFLWRTDGILSHIFDGLLGFDPNGNVIPRLATQRNWLGPKRLRLQLRKGVTFHDGSPFNAQIVAWNFQAIRDAKLQSARSSFLSNINTVEIVSEYEVDLILNQPDGTLEYALAAFSWMLPRHSLAPESTQAFGKAPIGTGPYQFSTWTKESGLRLQANPKYWGGPPSFLDGIQWNFWDEQRQVSEFLSGKLDLLGSVRPLYHPEIQRHPKTSILKSNSLMQVDIVFNCATQWGGNPDLREAIANAVHVEDIVRYVARGNGQAMRGSSMEGQFGHNPAFPRLKFDPNYARRLLAKINPQKRISLQGMLDPEYLLLGKSIQVQLRKVGIDLELETVTREELFRRTAYAKMTGQTLWDGDLFISASPDPTYHYYFINKLSSYSRGPFAFCEDKTYDAVFEEMLHSTSLTETRTLCAQLDALQAKSRSKISLYQVVKGYGIRDTLAFQPTKSGMLDLRFSRFRKGGP